MRKVVFSIAVFLLCLFSLQSKAQLVPDSTFGQNGYFITNYQGIATFAQRIKELSNGDILAVGTHDAEIRVWKYNSSGQLITTFGTNGIASNAALDLEPGNMHSLYDIEEYDNGKIMILSKLGIFVPNYDSMPYSIVLTSFNADGSINTNFNGTGYLKDNPDVNYEFNPFTLLMNKSEKIEIYVGGEAYEKGHSTCPAGKGKWFISKYNANGIRDLSFNGTGYLLKSAQVMAPGALYPHGRLRDLAFMPNGSVRAVGAYHNFDKSFFDFVVKQDGSFDSSFATNGISNYSVNYDVLFLETGTWSKILPDGSALFYTTSYGTTNSLVKFVKHKVDGSIDTNFGVNGLLTLDVPTQANFNIIYKSDNSMLLTYYKQYGTDQKIEFIRIKAQGVVDSSFGVNGLLITQPIVPDVYVNSSFVFDGTWNANETALFLSAAKQPVTYSNYGIFKYKWPGLTPLVTQNVSQEELSLVYPNPIKRGGLLQISNVSPDTKILLISLEGKLLHPLIKQTSVSSISLEVPKNCAAGNYYLRIQHAQNSKPQSLPILIQ